ncbi:MAG: hypothetical protein JNM29_01045 [Candidatus Odyssella sp.]|nr:hypothetical protein [Candidatus Odyssella sp.]
MSEREKPAQDENRRPPSGPVSSPRTYFGRASRAATGAMRTGISDPAEPGLLARAKRPAVYRAGDPALRLFAGLGLPLSPTLPITGAVATLSGIRDGEHEKLFVDLGTTLVRAARQRDDAAGTLRLALSRTQSAETYSALLGSLRYVNDAPALTAGARRIVLQIVDAGGGLRDVAEAQFSVGEAPEAAMPGRSPAPAAGAAEAGGASTWAGDARIVLGESAAFNTEGDYTIFLWPRRRAAPAERRRTVPPPAAPEAAAGSYFSAGGKLYRLFESPVAPAAAASPEGPPQAAPLAASAVLAAQTPAAANDSAPSPQRAANDAVWMPGRGVPPPGFARPAMLRLEDIFGSDMQDAIARRLIGLRIASSGA